MSRRNRKGNGLLVLVISVCVSTGVAAPAFADDAGDLDDSQTLQKAAVAAWIGEQAKASEDDQGRKTKRGYFSRDFRETDGAYRVTAHIETAGDHTKTTERYLLTLEKNGKSWEVADHELQDTYKGMHRESGASCHPFKQMEFNREGMRLAATNGSLCATYYQGTIAGFAVQADDATYRYEPPEHATALHLIPDFHAVFRSVKADHRRELDFKPAAMLFQCDPESCEDLIETHFEGLGELDRETKGFAVASWAAPLYGQLDKERRKNAFAHFRAPYRPQNKKWSVFVLRELDPFTYPGFEEGLFDFSGSLPGTGVHLAYDNWAGFEVTLNVWPRRLDDADQLFGTIYGYYSKETVANSDPYEIERRDDEYARWHQVYKVDGEVELGIENPEMLSADIEFGIELKQPLRELPFFIQSIPQRSFTGRNRPRVLEVNSVQLDGEELTWTRTSQLGGMVILPKEMPAGTKLNLRMDFKTHAMRKWTHSFIEVSRFGWMPFVRFADFIDEFELTVRSPAEFKVLGIGHLVEEKVEGDVRVTRWKADSPVVFPSMTLGKYREATPGNKFDPARKMDGTPIPVIVHVDEASSMDWDITPASLTPIAQQAVNSINLYRELSGLDYPYGKLHFVNDPRGLLYGQAPSSLIYLGQGVFRGEGFLATLPIPWDATGIAKFLKSVVAHEVGHQWWGSRVSNANQRNYWFVESLAEYFSALYLEGVYGKKEYNQQVDEWRRNILDANMKSSVQNASAIWSGEGGFGSYQAAVYNKGPFAFHMLREIFGDEKFFLFLKQFSQELAERREIVTLDIENAAEKALGGVGANGERYNADLGWFFDQWIRGSGLPQFRFNYTTRQTEDGGWMIEGQVEQRVVIGSKRDIDVLDGNFYRGIVDIHVKSKRNEFAKRLVIDGPSTPFQLKIMEKPLEVTLNDGNQMLAHEVLDNRPW